MSKRRGRKRHHSVQRSHQKFVKIFENGPVRHVVRDLMKEPGTQALRGLPDLPPKFRVIKFRCHDGTLGAKRKAS